MRIFRIFSTFSFIFFYDVAFAASSGSAIPDDNGLLYALCLSLMILTSRVMRAILILLMVGVGMLMIQGSLTWQKALTMIVGVFLLVAPAKVAIMILPAKISNVSGTLGNKTFNKAATYTPEEILSAACPSAM